MLDTQITQVSTNELDKIFADADDLVVGSEDTPTPVEETGDGTIPILDETLITDEEESEEDEVEDDTKEKTDTVEEKQEEEKEEEVKEEEEDKTVVNEVLKNTVKYLVSNKLWADWDGREDLEITEEVYAEIALQQAQHSASEMFNELIDGTGDYGKAIISHIKSGGNPEEVIDIFKEQKTTESIDTSTEEGKQLKIEQYYKDVLGWKPERVKKFVNRLVEDNEIDTEFESVEDSYKEHYKQKIQETQNKAEEADRKKREDQNKFVESIKSALNETADLTEKEKRQISSSILDFKHKLNNGKSVNDFYLKFAEMQQDPKQYIELVQFVTDKEAYKEKMRKKENSNASREQFNFIKGNTAISKAKAPAVTPEQNKDRTEKYKGTNFSFAIKK